MGFESSFSNTILQKIHSLFLGIYFDKNISTCDRFFMKLMNTELIDMIIEHLL